MGLQYSRVAKEDDFELIALQDSWILATDTKLSASPFKHLHPGAAFSSVGGTKRNSAGCPKLTAAKGWHYRFESLETRVFKILGHSVRQHQLFTFSAHSNEGEDALASWTDLLGRRYMYFCFAWHENIQMFGYSTVGCAGRQLDGDIQLLNEKPTVQRNRKTGYQLDLFKTELA